MSGEGVTIRERFTQRPTWILGLIVICGIVVITVAFTWLLFYLTLKYFPVLLPTDAIIRKGFTDYGEVGEYFNYFIGVPISITLLFVTAAAALFALRFVDRQGEIAILQFAQENFRLMNRNFGKFGQALHHIIITGDTIIRMYVYIAGREDSHLKEFIKELMEKDGEIVKLYETELISRKERVRLIDDTIREIADRYDYGRLISQTARLREDCLMIAEQMEILSRTPFSSAILREEFRKNGEINIVGSAVSLIDPEGKDYKLTAIKERKLLDLSTHLSDLAEDIDALDLLFWHDELPSESNALDLTGMMLAPRHVPAQENTKTRDGRPVERYIVNWGAALLITLYQLIPNRGRAIRLFREIFPNKSEIAEKFSMYAGPDIESVIPPSLSNYFDECCPSFKSRRWGFGKKISHTDPDNILTGGSVFYVHIKDGENDVIERYDRKKHGKFQVAQA